ncbi:hypothetical protein KR222_001151 [Zaprionus bogoriensis]|nr:hypothetical protein KR222_001151 [Zaprionus bogoriensis]
MWRCYKLEKHPGLLVIRNPFTVRGQRYWIARCLRDYPQKPNIINVNTKDFPDGADNWWEELHQCSDLNVTNRLRSALRWTTLGYHHNWDTKVYNEKMQSEFPNDLSRMCQFFSVVLGFTHFIPQAAIINYYPIGSNLSGHTDHSELNLQAPLFSFSFGQTAIFLIGGQTLEEQPTALFLRSGDVLIMSEQSRLCYHAVPRVMKENKQYLNYRTVPEMKTSEPLQTHSNAMNMNLYDKTDDESFWAPFSNYIKNSRININVRQVLPAGLSQIKL